MSKYTKEEQEFLDKAAIAQLMLWYQPYQVTWITIE